MADPMTILTTVIGGLVSVFGAYTTYKAALKQAEAKQEPAPEQSKAATEGVQAAQVIETLVTTHGKPEEQTALTGFQQNPEMFKAMLIQTLHAIANREPAAAQQLQALAAQAGSNAGGIQIGGDAKVYGPVVGTNDGEIKVDYRFGKEE